MTKNELIGVISQIGSDIDYQEPVITFSFNDAQIICIYDENADRMRFISPIISREDISEEVLEEAMVANFHSALDARYAISRGVVYSAFIHPLGSLDKTLAISAISQVASAALTFGSEYSGGTFIFGG